MAFKYKRTIGGVGQKLEKILLGSSLTYTVGQAVETATTGVVLTAVAAKVLLGVIVSICDKDGLPIKSTNPVAGTASSPPASSASSSSSGPAV